MKTFTLDDVEQVQAGMGYFGVGIEGISDKAWLLALERTEGRFLELLYGQAKAIEEGQLFHGTEDDLRKHIGPTIAEFMKALEAAHLEQPS